MKEKQLLRDAEIEPTMEVVARELGSASESYIRFLEELEKHDIHLTWRYYNDGKAWLGKGLYHWLTARGTQKETNTFWLSIWDGFFKVTIYVPEKARIDALTLSLNNKTKTMIEEAEQMGKLKFFPLTFNVCSSDLFDEILTLIDFRKTLK